VRVPLHDDRPVLLADRRVRLVEPVDDGALAEELRLARVHVLSGERVVVVELPRLEPEHLAACVGEREHEPPLEVVLAASACKTRRRKLVPSEALRERLSHERVSAERQTEPEDACDLLAEPTPLQVVACVRANLRLPQRTLVVRGGLVEQLEEARPAAATRY